MASMERHNKAALKDQIRRLEHQLSLSDNRECFDCDAVGPRWASTNLGIFICMRCAGIHRSLGVHISKVKSINMDLWEPSMIHRMESVGNLKGRSVYLARAPEGYRKPTIDCDDREVERLMREKWELKKFFASNYEEILNDLVSGKQEEQKKEVTASNSSSSQSLSVAQKGVTGNNKPEQNATRVPRNLPDASAKHTKSDDDFLDFNAFTNAPVSANVSVPDDLFSFDSKGKMPSQGNAGFSSNNMGGGSTALDFFSVPNGTPSVSQNAGFSFIHNTPGERTAAPAPAPAPVPKSTSGFGFPQPTPVFHQSAPPPPLQGLTAASQREFSSSSILAAFDENPFGLHTNQPDRSKMACPPMVSRPVAVPSSQLQHNTFLPPQQGGPWSVSGSNNRAGQPFW